MYNMINIVTSSRYLPHLSLAGCWVVAFSLSCSISSSALIEVAQEAGLARAVFKGARQTVSTQFAETADEYFHLGVSHQSELAFYDSFYQKLAGEMQPDGHVHLEGDGLKESMPWYWLAIKMDPHNIQNYLVTAYWVSGAIGDITMAHDILQEARRSTSLHHEIEFEDAILYLSEKNLIEAENAIDVALKIWPSGQDPLDEQALLSKIHILSYKALLREVSDDKEGAIRYFGEMLLITPEDEDLKKRINSLLEGNQPSRLAKNIMDAMLNARGSHDDCGREHSEHEPH